MHDPLEGVAADGTIVTGAARHRVPAAYEPLLTAVSARLVDGPSVSVYLYGSVATGQACVGRSDLDVLTFGVPPDRAAGASAELSARYAGLCRGVEISPARDDELRGDGDEPYGLRVFLRHYCVHLSGPNRHRALPAYPADVRAARAFNGDIGRRLAAWRHRADDDPPVLGRRVGRKTLLAVAGLVSASGSTWTTDRARAAREHAARRPQLADELAMLLAWAAGDLTPDRAGVRAVLRAGGVIEQIVDEFAGTIGLWPDLAVRGPNPAPA